MICDKLDNAVKEKQPISAQPLWELLQDCRKTIPGDYLIKLIERMPRVCKAVIKAKNPKHILVCVRRVQIFDWYCVSVLVYLKTQYPVITFTDFEFKGIILYNKCVTCYYRCIRQKDTLFPFTHPSI